MVVGGWSKDIFVSTPTFELSWGCDNYTIKKSVQNKSYSIIDESPELSKSMTGNITFQCFRERRPINEDKNAKFSVLDNSLDPLT